MKEKYVWLILLSSIFVVCVCVTNFTVVGWFLKRHYTYSNYNGTFRFDEMRFKGVTYASRDERYKRFLENHPEVKDQQLYRTFRLDPWRFWEWREWVEHFDRFRLPYISKEEIQRNREAEGPDIKH